MLHTHDKVSREGLNKRNTQPGVDKSITAWHIYWIAYRIYFQKVLFSPFLCQNGIAVGVGNSAVLQYTDTQNSFRSQYVSRYNVFFFNFIYTR